MADDAPLQLKLPASSGLGGGGGGSGKKSSRGGAGGGGDKDTEAKKPTHPNYQTDVSWKQSATSIVAAKARTKC